ERRRSAPDEGPEGERHARLKAELAAERRMIEQLEQERAQRLARIERTRGAIARDSALGPELATLLEALEAASAAIADCRGAFEAALADHRAAGEHISAELRECAQREAGLQSELHREHEALTEAEVKAQRSRDQAADGQAALRELASRLELEPEPAVEELD